MGSTTVGAVVGFLIGAGGMGYLTYMESQEPVMFARKWVDVKGDYAKIEGSIVGGDGSKAEDNAENGVISLTCWRPDMSCTVQQAGEVAHNHVALYDSGTVKVTKWANNQMTISSEDEANPDQCNFYVIQVDGRTESASYTRIPKSAAGPCGTLEQRIIQWKIDDGIAWKT